MTLETRMQAALLALCPRVFPDVAELGTEAPYVTWQQTGGQAPVYQEGALPDKLNALVQINTWADTRKEASGLMRTIEAVLVADTSLNATPVGALVSDVDDDSDLRGAIQEFSLWVPRT
jgi:hypothetical protein